MDSEWRNRLSAYQREKLSSRSKKIAKEPTDDSYLNDRWLNSEEAGAYIGYSDWTVRDFAKRKLIKHTKLPGVAGGYRFKRQWLDDFMEARAINPKQSMIPPPKPVLQLVPSLEDTNPELWAAMQRVKKRNAKQSKQA